MIRIRRVRSRIPVVRCYEIERSGHGGNHQERLRRGRAVRYLESVVGIADAWSFIDEADRQFAAGVAGWAVEFEEMAG